MKFNTMTEQLPPTCSDLVDGFLFAREGEGEAQRETLSLQVLSFEEISETGSDVVEELVGEKDTSENQLRSDTFDRSKANEGVAALFLIKWRLLTCSPVPCIIS